MTFGNSRAILTALAAFLGGGLMGALFTWYINRPQVTLITYSLTTTPLATPEATTVIPDLTVQVGGERIATLFTHNIEFAVQRGPQVKNVEVAVTFPTKVRIFGKKVEKPSQLHSIACSDFAEGVRCTMSPMGPKGTGNYLLSIGINEKEAPKILTVAQNVDLLSIEDFVAREEWPFGKGISPTLFYTFIVIAVFQMTLTLFVTYRRIR